MSLPEHGNGTADPSATRTRILAVASQLFADRGFHAVSIRDIAKECGVSVSTVLYPGNSKQQLIERILADAFSEQTPLVALATELEAAKIGNLGEFYALFDRVATALVQHHLQFPQVRRLWLRLLLDDPALFAQFDATYSWPLVSRIFALLQAVRDRGVIQATDDQLRFFVASIDWMLDGFAAGGYQTLQGERIPADRLASFDLEESLKYYARKYFGN